MNPLAILSIIQLGASIIGGLRAQQAAADQQRLMEVALDRQGQATEAALNAAANVANRNVTSLLAPYYSALQGRGLSALASEAGAAGLANSGLATAAKLGFRNEIAAQFGKDLLNYEAQKALPLLQAQMQAAGNYMDAARLRAQMSGAIGEMGQANLSWLPELLKNYPDLFNFGSTFKGDSLPEIKLGPELDSIFNPLS